MLPFPHVEIAYFSARRFWARKLTNRAKLPEEQIEKIDIQITENHIPELLLVYKNSQETACVPQNATYIILILLNCLNQTASSPSTLLATCFSLTLYLPQSVCEFNRDKISRLLINRTLEKETL